MKLRDNPKSYYTLKHATSMDHTPEQFSKTMYAAGIVPLWKLTNMFNP
jgi:hypothetical protein